MKGNKLFNDVILGLVPQEKIKKFLLECIWQMKERLSEEEYEEAFEKIFSDVEGEEDEQ